MSWIDFGIVMATVWCVGCYAPIIVDWYRTDMIGGFTRTIYLRLATQTLWLVLLIILQVMT